MDPKPVPKNSFLAGLPAPWPADLLPEIQRQVQASRRKVVVVDDDPTGTQTVHGVPVLTGWSIEALRSELANDLPAFYVLTNSRSLTLAEAQRLQRELGRNLRAAAGQAGCQFVVVSRSDSTLRGHFPGEVEALVAGLDQDFDAWLLIPFFLEGGRYTVHDVHYVAEGERLVPAGQTEFARDAAFGYRASNLRQWVEEKSGGRIPAGQVASISLETIRRGGPEGVTAGLMQLAGGRVGVVNAAGMADLQVFTQGLLAAEAQGKRFLYRTAASFVPVRAGLVPRPLLAPAELALPQDGGGLVVVGSYVPRTSGQVEQLLAQGDVVPVEVDVAALLDDRLEGAELERAAGRVNQALSRGQDTLLLTSRRLVTGATAEESLAIGRRVSAGLVAIVRGLAVRPRYLLAKGGITSSDLATDALGVRRAMVLGQVLPGVPVWQLGPESRAPGLAYFVFPGNVGEAGALAALVARLKRPGQD